MSGPAQPSARATFPLGVAIALTLLSWALLVISVHNLVETGTCSSTGYTQYGPAPHCGSHSGLYVAALIGGLVLTFASMASAVPGWVQFLGLFGSIGIGSLLVAVGWSPPHVHRGFAIGFGLSSIAVGVFAARRLGGGRRERMP